MDGALHLDAAEVGALGDQLRRAARAVAHPTSTSTIALPADRRGAAAALADLLGSEHRLARSVAEELDELARRCDLVMSDVMAADLGAWSR